MHDGQTTTVTQAGDLAEPQHRELRRPAVAIDDAEGKVLVVGIERGQEPAAGSIRMKSRITGLGS
jgi:hypothetical protein